MRDSYTRELKDIVVIDGDTVRATIRLGFGVEIAHQLIRLYGVNAYETTRRGKWDNHLPEEEVQRKLKLGKEGKEQLAAFIRDSIYVGFKSIVSPKDIARKGKYGRWLGHIYVETEDELINWGDFLIEKNFGYKVDYD